MEQLKFVMVGHVDHGKSTLIGRLFFDTNSLPPDKMAEVEASSKELGREVEFAFLMDHLQEEREQGITIDTAQTFFKTAKREYVIIDAPGHVEFVKNMITGASQAEAGLLIIDGEEGVQEQTKRHSYILGMLGMKQIVVLINKMDLVGFQEKRYQELQKAMTEFLGTLNVKAKYFIPISAMKGDNVAKRSENMNWYSGPTVLEALDSLETHTASEQLPFLFPVQDTYKIDDKRIIVGRLESGILRQNDEIKVLPSLQKTKIKSIEKFLENNVTSVTTGESIGVTTADALFIERGHIICREGSEPILTDTFSANIFWLSKQDFDIKERLILRCATQEISCKVEEIKQRLNSSSLELLQEKAESLKYLEVGEVVIKTKQPIGIENFNDVPELGRFVLVKGDNVCAGGIIIKTSN